MARPRKQGRQGPSTAFEHDDLTDCIGYFGGELRGHSVRAGNCDVGIPGVDRVCLRLSSMGVFWGGYRGFASLAEVPLRKVPLARRNVAKRSDRFPPAAQAKTPPRRRRTNEASPASIFGSRAEWPAIGKILPSSIPAEEVAEDSSGLVLPLYRLESKASYVYRLRQERRSTRTDSVANVNRRPRRMS